VNYPFKKLINTLVIPLTIFKTFMTAQFILLLIVQRKRVCFLFCTFCFSLSVGVGACDRGRDKTIFLPLSSGTGSLPFLLRGKFWEISEDANQTLYLCEMSFR